MGQVLLLSITFEYYENEVGRKADPLPGKTEAVKTDYQYCPISFLILTGRALMRGL